MVALRAEADWAVEEFGAADVGDQRRRARVVELATVLGSRPQASLPQACEDPALLKAAYRFFANDALAPDALAPDALAPDALAPDALAPDALVASHVRATLAWVETAEVVLAVQDTTHRDWSAHPATTGLGLLSTERQRGLLAHTTLALAVTPERVPLGLLAQERWTRPVEEVGKKHARRARAIADKESHKWLTSVQAVGAATDACPRTHFISVGDAEADVYDLFLLVYDLFLLERRGRVDLLVRAAQDRRLAEPEQQRLRAALAARPVAATVTLAVPRQGDRVARTATLAVQWQRVTLRPPTARAAEHLAEVTVWAVWAAETAPPPDAEPLDWLLLTTVPLHTSHDALPCVEDDPCGRHDAAKWPAHLPRCAHLRGVVRLPLGHRGLSQGPQERVCHRAPPIAGRGSPPALPGPLQRGGLARALCYDARARAARRGLHRAAGGGRVAGPLLPHPPDHPAAPGSAHTRPGGALDRAVGRLPGPRSRRPPGRDRPLARLPAPGRSHRHVPCLPPSASFE